MACPVFALCKGESGGFMARWHACVLISLLAIGGLCGLGAASEGADLNPAMSRPDGLAWELLAQIARPAADNNVLFETWASDIDTFGDEPRWPSLGAGVRKVLINRIQPRGSKQPGAIPPVTHCAPDRIWACVGKETLRNRPAFEFIVDNKLTTRRGLAAFFGRVMDFPVDTIEVKAEWLPVSALKAWNGVTAEEAPALYYISDAKFGDETVRVALVALHIITKQVPNWTWATFEHWNNPGRCDDTGCRDTFGADEPVMAAQRKPNLGYARCHPSEALRRLFKDSGVSEVWLNYCLKGTQTDFITATGEATRLGNSVAETINAGVPHGRSSCMTCHAEAAFDRRGRSAKAEPKIGAPLPTWFTGNGSTKVPQYRPADFVWAIPFCAKPDDGISACVPPHAAKATAAR
jgi:hypothetical protein